MFLFVCRTVQMRLYTLTKRHFVMVFVAFFVAFFSTLIIGLAGLLQIESIAIDGQAFFS